MSSRIFSRVSLLSQEIDSPTIFCIISQCLRWRLGFLKDMIIGNDSLKSNNDFFIMGKIVFSGKPSNMKKLHQNTFHKIFEIWAFVDISLHKIVLNFWQTSPWNYRFTECQIRKNPWRSTTLFMSLLSAGIQ